MTEDPEISRRYHSLPREEPPRHLDAAILAKARRAVASRGRWHFPLAAAAVLVLAVAVTMHVERGQPDEEQVAIQGQQETERALAKAETQEIPKAAAPPQERKPELRESARADAQYAAKPEPAAPPAPAADAPMRRESLAAATGIASSNFMHASPEQWLQGIADLRKQNRDDEADRQLAEFRKRYPDHRISKEMLERVEMPK
jgi:hypothetical protein